MQLLIKTRTLSLLSRISDVLAEHNVKAYLVGGFVRDVLLGRTTADIDIAVTADALKIAPQIADALGGTCVPLDTENGVARVVLANEVACNIDVSTIEGGVDDDLARRDFTVNAIAVGLKQLVAQRNVELIDLFDGQGDLRDGIIRSVSERAFELDAVRLLRAVRLAAELGFEIDEETEAQIRRSSHLIGGVAGERVREELLKILAQPRASYFLRYLDQLGLLTAIVPEISPSKGVTQPTEHVWDVFDHSLETVTAVEFLLRQGKWVHVPEEVLGFVPWSEKLAGHFEEEVSNGSTRSSLLKLSALLHDIAKPRAKTIEADGKMRFLGHAEEGARIAAEVLERLRFSNKEIKLVEISIKYHLRPVQMSNNDLPTARAIYRYFRDTGEAGIDIIFLSLADHLAARGATLLLEEWKGHAQEMNYVLTQRLQEESVVSPPRLVDGHDIITVFGISPGPRIGRILEEVREAQAAGELSTRQQALSFIKEHLLYERV